MALGSEARDPQQPFFGYPTQQWGGALIENSHTEALYAYGEFALFTLMWRVEDFEAGLVGRCPTCYLGDRGAAVFQQSPLIKCPDCYGTTFEGGFRAQIIRPAIIVHSSPTDDATIRGDLNIDNINMETSTDFVMHHGDYVFREDGDRYQTSEKQEDSVHDGFSVMDSQSPYVANIAEAKLEDPTSVAYTIPVEVGGGSATLHDLLDRSNFGVHTATAADVLRPNGYL